VKKLKVNSEKYRNWKMMGLKGLVAVALILLLSSCGWIQGKVDDKEVKELDDQMQAFKRETIMDEALINLGQMLIAYDIAPTPIQSQNIGNETADKGVPNDLYVMLSTAINKVGREVVFVPYDTQYIINEATTGGTIQRIYPDAVISGGITGVDKDLIQKEREGDIAGGWAGASASARYSAGMNVSRITLDLNMRSYKTQSFFPGVLASNAIVIRQDRLGWAVSASYMDFSASFESEVKTKQGIYAALRFLVELSTVELLGKYFSVPYWKCIKGASTDKTMVTRLKDNIETMPTGRQIRYIKKYLYLSGFTGIDKASDTLSPSEQAVFSSQMKIYGVNDYPSLFIAVWENLPMDKSTAIISKDRKKQQRDQKKREAQEREQALEKQKLQQQKQSEMVRQLEINKGKYETAVTQGDKYYTEGDLANAYNKYNEALGYIPKDQYATDQLARTKSLMESIVNMDKAYKEAIAKGDDAYNTQNYSAALEEYQKAQSLKTGDLYSTGMVIKVEKIVKDKNPTGITDLSEEDWSGGNN